MEHGPFEFDVFFETPLTPTRQHAWRLESGE
jgi:hypothetical protein